MAGMEIGIRGHIALNILMFVGSQLELKALKAGGGTTHP
jgi:hypothetical protein